ncbi:hypothetical protein Y032_0019g3936 [Ancylostoma ceylanicum]|uniref:Uncharacterized protein n=1 Tax=Ancylostoma ceylanicum TaxID=53326 RepID=A0A016V1V6_9BILA|nr:hypothetical protein Y032_0019g3936 [Ancylostoma ceylanicum]
MDKPLLSQEMDLGTETSVSNTTNGDKMPNLRRDFPNFVARLHTAPHLTPTSITPTQAMDFTIELAGLTRLLLGLVESVFIDTTQDQSRRRIPMAPLL